jgi:inhibitor of KinA sporulation pathway (predicted exonuclease)
MNYIIFDLEWNQPPDESAIVQQPVYLTGEIIQIGAVKLDDSFQPVDEIRLYIKPQFYTKMHRRIASLTGIHDKDLQEKGQFFPEAFAQFRSWCGEECAYMTWSTSDLPMLVDNILLHGIELDALPVCYDIQRIFDREIMRSSQRHSLDHALEILNESGDAAHDALHDARNTAKVCNHLDLDAYLEEYGSKVFFEKPNLHIYKSLREVMEDPELKSFECPWCAETVPCEPWMPYRYANYIAMGSCEEGDEFFVQLNPQKHCDGTFRVQRLFFEMSDDLWEIYQDQKEMNQERSVL